MHRHPHWELIYQREGWVVTRQESRPIEMAPGMILLHRPGVRHCDIADRRYSISFAGIDCSEELGWPHLCFDDGDRTIGNHLDAMARESRHIEQPNNTLLRFMVLQLDIFMRRKQSELRDSPLDRKIAEAKSILDGAIESCVDLDLLAAKLGMGRSSFFAHFTDRCGRPPREYVRAIRIQRALSMLRQSDFTLETIAQRCGFHSASHLTRQIKSHTGKRPGELRENSVGQAAR